MGNVPVVLSRYERIARSLEDPSTDNPIVYCPRIEEKTVVHYLTVKIAQILHDTVACPVENRSELDWVHAERIVLKHFKWFIRRATGEVQGTPDLALQPDLTYEEFETKFGRTVWENARKFRSTLPHPPYGGITFF